MSSIIIIYAPLIPILLFREVQACNLAQHTHTFLLIIDIDFTVSGQVDVKENEVYVTDPLPPHQSLDDIELQQNIVYGINPGPGEHTVSQGCVDEVTTNQARSTHGVFSESHCDKGKDIYYVNDGMGPS